MKLKQISIPMENAPRRLWEFTRALEENRVNVRSLNLVDTGELGELRVLLSDLSPARRILMQQHIPARVDEVVAVEMDAGSPPLSAMLEDLLAAGVVIRYAYTMPERQNEKPLIVFCCDDNERAAAALSKRTQAPSPGAAPPKAPGLWA
jgi:hypothetical protein